MVDRTGQIWVVNEGLPSEVYGLITSRNDEQSGYGATYWNILILQGWRSGTDTWGENDNPHSRFEAQRGLRRVA